MYIYMYNLLIMNENFFNGYNIIILDIFYFCIILFGIFIITTKNPIHSILYLIFLFSIIALYLIYLELDFIGLSYLIVYIGAVSILFLFILMLINVRTSEIQSNTNNSIPLILMILILFSNTLTKTLPNNIYVDNNSIIRFNNNFKNLLFVTDNTWDNNLIGLSYITNIGNIIYTSHNIWLIIVSFILLLAMTGVIIITISYDSYNTLYSNRTY